MFVRVEAEYRVGEVLNRVGLRHHAIRKPYPANVA
jgi:hypothetical protein